MDIKLKESFRVQDFLYTLFLEEDGKVFAYIVKKVLLDKISSSR